MIAMGCKPVPWLHKVFLLLRGKNLFALRPGTRVEFQFDGDWISATVDKLPCTVVGIVQIALRDVDFDFAEKKLTGIKTTVPVNRLRKIKNHG